MLHNSSFERTDKSIMNAMIKLMERKPFEKITVQDILDETPVSRATFYSHYQDKYEIAEKMLDLYKNERHQTITTIDDSISRLNKGHVLKMKSTFYRQLCESLSKIHTEHVDFRKTIAEDYSEEYLEHHEVTEKSKLEARIYAQLRAEMKFAIMEDDLVITVADFEEIMNNVGNYLIGKFKK